jgi:hypothetical protein
LAESADVGGNIELIARPLSSALFFNLTYLMIETNCGSRLAIGAQVGNLRYNAQ